MFPVTVIADSISRGGSRITTIQATYWRGIHAELMTHRAFSRNASSSRAIPVSTVLKQVWSNPAGPLHWGKNQAGMQAKGEISSWRKRLGRMFWGAAAKTACVFAWSMMKLGVHKQVANRLLEPFQYITVIITSTEWQNFFELRCHPDAQPEMQVLANRIRSAMDNSFPVEREVGEWHLPYITEGDWKRAHTYLRKMRTQQDMPSEEDLLHVLIKCSVARCARVSYLTHDGLTPSISKDLALHDKLVVARPRHASPAEHQAAAFYIKKNFRNLRGWIPYRAVLEEQLPYTILGKLGASQA